ncbi:MAG: hypothetical protein DHS20C14_02230 [Phycisphaeraceae bacterium]|nr:MAG: hypothetical protein DHS20C14_02230 [Phycisphaeraceae bacterium]
MGLFPELPMVAWLVLALLGAGVCVAMVRSLGSVALAQVESHELSVEVHALRLEYERRLRDRENGVEPDLGEDEIIEVSPVDEV